ncbi:uncharacterized protein L201_004629 [Kwoniella dendrophila CBS 6074]|uniref:Velvet domain-containing protein n=1 Tax=Kwoniella dendrophila CBS 6074 TaxID=1295534 RepID=A0AAX4JXR4_9TREE
MYNQNDNNNPGYPASKSTRSNRRLNPHPSSSIPTFNRDLNITHPQEYFIPSPTRAGHIPSRPPNVTINTTSQPQRSSTIPVLSPHQTVHRPPVPRPILPQIQDRGQIKSKRQTRVVHPPQPQLRSQPQSELSISSSHVNPHSSYQNLIPNDHDGQVVDHITSVDRMPPPPPPADNSHSIGTSILSGFQTDYSRVFPGPRQQREDSQLGIGLRRAPNSDSIRSTMVKNDEANKPVPPEAYIIMRPHRLPNKGWNDGIAREMIEAESWNYELHFELHFIQQPTRGKALGLVPLPRGWPALSAPLIVQLIVKDQIGNVISVDHPVLNRKLVHTSMTVDLVSEDGTQSRSFMRVRPVSDPNKTPSPNTARLPDPEMFCGTQRNLLGSLHRSGNPYILDGQKGIYFLFTELVVRNVGVFALKVSLLDLAGPAHLGTSIGITKTISSALTQPFTVHHATEFPGAIPVTDLSMEFTRQGERNLGRRTRADNNGISSEDDLINHQSYSPENQDQ